MNQKITWRFSPSVVEQYYGKGQCEKAVLLCGINDDDRVDLGWQARTQTNSTATEAGETWI